MTLIKHHNESRSELKTSKQVGRSYRIIPTIGRHHRQPKCTAYITHK